MPMRFPQKALEKLNFLHILWEPHVRPHGLRQGLHAFRQPFMIRPCAPMDARTASSPRAFPARETATAMALPAWKDKLQGQIREDWAREIDQFEAQIALRKQGKIDEKVFAETR